MAEREQDLESEDFAAERLAAEAATPTADKGLRISTNPNNGFTAIRLHYTADPAKRSAEWKRKAAFGMDLKAWNTEMELSWEVYAGEPVYGKEFSQELHISKEYSLPDSDYPLLIRGWDFGGNHSCCIVQYAKNVVKVIDEFPNMGFNTRRIAQDVIEECNLRYGPEFRYIEVIDPSGLWEGKTSDGMACADVLRELNLEILPGEQEPTRRIDSVMKLLVTLRAGVPGLLLNPSCPMLTAGFIGGYHYPERETQNQRKNRPEKNEYSHIHDALQYACTRIHDVGNVERWSGQSVLSEGYSYEL